jgi:predicted TIM-barrel fold metal-dependent hydrolase
MQPLHSPTSTDRRTWIRSCAAAIGVAAFANLPLEQRAKAQPAPKPTSGKTGSWIDAHVHVWPAVDQAYPLASGFQADVVQPASFTPDTLFKHCRPCDVERVVLIQMNFFGFDNRYMLDTIAKYPGVFSGVAVIDHDQPDLRRTMSTMRDQGVRGYRLYATADNVAKWQSSPSIQSMFRYAADLGQSMCMLSDPEALDGIEGLCERNPQTSVVIDHFSRIGMRTPPTEDQLDRLCKLAKSPRVSVKTSAFYALGNKRPPYTDLLPMIRRLLDAFGPDRLMWASDCPYQVEAPHTYEASIALIRDHLDNISIGDREYLLGKTAERVFFS